MAYNLIKESHRLLTYFYHLFYDVPIGFRNYSDDLIYILFHFIYISYKDNMSFPLSSYDYS